MSDEFDFDAGNTDLLIQKLAKTLPEEDRALYLATVDQFRVMLKCMNEYRALPKLEKQRMVNRLVGAPTIAAFETMEKTMGLPADGLLLGYMLRAYVSEQAVAQPGFTQKQAEA